VEEWWCTELASSLAWVLQMSWDWDWEVELLETGDKVEVRWFVKEWSRCSSKDVLYSRYGQGSLERQEGWT
jgi:hypothetical protein